MKLLKKNLLFFYTVFLIIGCNESYSQSKDKKEIEQKLKQSGQFYNENKQFELTSIYKLFPNFTSNKAEENFKGTFIKNNSEYYSKLKNTEFIYTDGYYIKIDNESKLMELSKINPKDEQKVYDVEKYTGFFNVFKLTENDSDWICTMETPAISFVPYSKVIIYIDKSNYSIKKQILYLITSVGYKDAKGKMKSEYPRIEIEFNGFKKQQVSIEIIEKNNFLQIKKGKFYPSKKYNSYKIVNND